jgi:phenylalanyl-tRNA synthetase alpha chain
MKEQLDKLNTLCVEAFKSAETVDALETIKTTFLGKKGELTHILKQVPSLPLTERPIIGTLANKLKQSLIASFDSYKSTLETAALEKQFLSDSIDTTLPVPTSFKGGLHPITQTIELISDLFARLGYSVKTGQEIETEEMNFEKLNIPEHHPARDMHDTFYLKDGRVLRTHTSPIQIRTMLKEKPPLRFLAPGKVYRCDSDSSHSPVFHQIEGLFVDKNVTFSNLKWTLEFFLQELFGKHKKVRFRPSYFPFTEPSTEVDVECMKCNGSGCSLCKKTGWLEIMGAGMVQRKVFEHVNYDPEEITGFAFGMGVDRIAMLLFGIPDIKLFYENDLRFLRQF